MRQACLLIILLLCSLVVAAQQDSLPSYDRMMLAKLLKQRKDQFGNYTESLEKTSGIFGGKTKKDWKQSAEVLTRIVRLDNQMISILNRKINYTTFEKTSFSYESLQANEKQAALQNELTYIKKNLDASQSENARLRELAATRYRLFILFLVSFIAALLVVLFLAGKKFMSSSATR